MHTQLKTLLFSTLLLFGLITASTQAMAVSTEITGVPSEITEIFIPDLGVKVPRDKNGEFHITTKCEVGKEYDLVDKNGNPIVDAAGNLMRFACPPASSFSDTSLLISLGLVAAGVAIATSDSGSGTPATTPATSTTCSCSGNCFPTGTGSVVASGETFDIVTGNLIGVTIDGVAMTGTGGVLTGGLFGFLGGSQNCTLTLFNGTDLTGGFELNCAEVGGPGTCLISCSKGAAPA